MENAGILYTGQNIETADSFPCKYQYLEQELELCATMFYKPLHYQEYEIIKLKSLLLCESKKHDEHFDLTLT